MKPCRFLTAGCTCTVLLAMAATTVHGQELSWAPVGADGPFVLAGWNGVGDPTEIVLVPGLGYRVEFELRVSGWADAPGPPTLGTIQATLDADSLLGVNADPPNPGVDLLTLNEPPYGALTGQYMQLKSCLTFTNVNTGQQCDRWVPPLPPCPPATYCGDNPDWVFAGSTGGSGVSTRPPPFTWGAFTMVGVCKTDTGGRSWYAGTFIFDVPAAATGRYSLRFNAAPTASFLGNCAGTRIPDLVLTPGVVTLELSDCNNNGNSDAEDIATGVSEDCDANEVPDECEADGDGDGVIDACDPCPLDNPDDTDGDGVCDSEDGCPNDPDKIGPGVCGCGVSDDTDSDVDGVLDCVDVCPDVDDAVFAPECNEAIPALSTWNLIVLALLLVTGAKLYFGRRSAVSGTA